MHPLSLCFLTILVSLAGRGAANADIRQVLSDRQCIHYEKGGLHAFHCEGKIRMTSTLFKTVIIPSQSMVTVVMDCEDGVGSNPYKYLPLFDLQGYDNLAIHTIGCPPPEEGYSFLRTRKGENVSFIGEDYQSIILNIICTDKQEFSLRGHHFRKLGNINVLRISCPRLSHAENDIFSETNPGLVEIEIQNTSLKSIPALSRFENLEILTVSGNQLASVPSLQACRALAQFDVTNNKIEHLDDDTFEYTKNLKFVFLSNNRLSRLPTSLLGLKQLEILKAYDNFLKVVDLLCLAALPAIRRIDLEGNHLQQLDPRLNMSPKASFESPGADPKENITMDAAAYSGGSRCPAYNTRAEGHSLSSRYPYCAWLRGNRLILKNNSITEIPERLIRQLEKLEMADFSFNMISNLPPNIFHNNKCLRELLMSDNNITSVSETLLANNTKMQVLNLSNNRISSIGPAFFSGLLQLTAIDLSNNLISTLPDEIFLPFRNKSENDIKKPLFLNLEGNLLTSLPPLTLPRLTELRAARNRLVRLPADTLKQVPLLQRIDLSHNMIERVEPRDDPPSASKAHLGDDDHSGPEDAAAALFHDKLESLTDVNLSHNRLTGIATVLTFRANLKHLNLKGNRFADYLDMFHTDGRYSGNVLGSLETLDMSNNSMAAPCNIPRQESSPPHFKYPRMMALKLLDLSWNRLTLSMSYNDTKIKKNFHLTNSKGSCDWFLKHMPRLEVLKLSHNEIDVIPEYVRYLTKLRELDLSHNKIHVVQFHDFFYVDGLPKRMVDMLGESEWDYVRRKDYFELPNSHNLTVDLRHNQIAAAELPQAKMQIVRRGNKGVQTFSKATLLLGNNPVVCSCQVLQLMQYEQGELRPVTEQEMWRGEKLMLPATIDLRNLSCSQPETVRGKMVSEPETWIHHILPLCGLCPILDSSKPSPPPMIRPHGNWETAARMLELLNMVSHKNR